MKLSRLRATLAATIALVGLTFLVSPAAALAPAAPASAVFVILPGGTATSATVAMQMPGGVPIPIGTLNPTTGKFLPAGLGTAATMGVGTTSGTVAPGNLLTALPACAAGSTIAPVPAGQPFQCAGLILIAQ